jgi:HEAT repeat protein
LILFLSADAQTRSIPDLVRDLISDDVHMLGAAVDGLTKITTSFERNDAHSDAIHAGAVQASGNIPEEAIRALVNLLNSGDPNILTSACEALRDICSAKDHARAAVLTFGGVPPLVHLLSHNSTQVKVMAASALWKVCAHNPAADAAQKQNVLPIVIGLLASSELKVQRSAALLLSNLCFASKSARVQALHSVPVLVCFIASNDTQLHAAAAQALLNITILERAQKVSVKANGIPALVKLISSDSDTDSMIFACGALRNICWTSDRARADALIVGAVPALLRLLLHECTQVKTMAASALWKVCRHDPAAVVLQKLRGVPVVVSLLALNNSDVQKSAALLLSNLCFASTSARLDALGSGAIPTLVHLIQSNDSNVHPAAAQALVNINILEQAQRASVEANALPALVKLLNSRDNDVLKFSCGALRSICWVDPHARDVAKCAGAVPALSYLLSHGNNQVQTMARKALKKIS